MYDAERRLQCHELVLVAVVKVVVDGEETLRAHSTGRSSDRAGLSVAIALQDASLLVRSVEMVPDNGD